MNKRDDKLLVEFNKEDIPELVEWKKVCLYIFGIGGIKGRIVEFIKKDLKTLKNSKKFKDIE